MKTSRGVLGVLVVICLGVGTLAHAASSRVEGRLFAGGADVAPKEINDELHANSIKKVTTGLLIGGEETYSLLDRLSVGLRYMKMQISRDEDPPDKSTNYEVGISQDMLLAVTRLPLVKSSLVRIDTFAGFGGVTSRLKLKSSAQTGELTKNGSGDLFTNSVSVAGASLAFGYKNLYLVLEAGYLNDKVSSFKRTSGLNDNMQTMDLSGTYATVGFLFTNGGGTSTSSKK